MVTLDENGFDGKIDGFYLSANKLYLDHREKRGKDKMERKKKFERKASFCGRSELDTVELTWVILHWAE